MEKRTTLSFPIFPRKFHPSLISRLQSIPTLASIRAKKICFPPMYHLERKKFPAHPISIFPSFPPPPPGNPCGKMQEEEVGHKVCPSILQGGGKRRGEEKERHLRIARRRKERFANGKTFICKKIRDLNEHLFF